MHVDLCAIQGFFFCLFVFCLYLWRSEVISLMLTLAGLALIDQSQGR